MALKGINPNTSIAYVPKTERACPPDEQTVFWISPRTTMRANVSASRYMKARREGKRGEIIMDEKRMVEADIKEFLEMITKVDNYIYSTQYSQYRNDDGTDKIWQNITDRLMLEAIYRDLPNEIFIELLEASSDMSVLTEGEKKS